MNLTLAGYVSVGAGDGENRLSLEGENVLKLGKSAPLGHSVGFEGGSGEDSLAIKGRNVTLAGSLIATTHGGDDSLTIQGINTFLGADNDQPTSVRFNSGEGDDTFAITSDKATATGNLNVYSGLIYESQIDDTDTIAINAGSFHAPALNFTGSRGDDTLHMNVDDLKLSHLGYSSLGGSDSVTIEADGRIRGALVEFRTVTNDTNPPNPGASQVSVVSSEPGGLVIGRPTPFADLRVDYSVSFSATVGASIDDLNIENVTFNNTLVISTNAQEGESTVRLSEVKVLKDLSVNAGSADDVISLDNLRVSGGLAIRTGNGEDLVEIERGVGVGPSQVAKLAEIILCGSSAAWKSSAATERIA
jgi:hypothetical protein